MGLQHDVLPGPKDTATAVKVAEAVKPKTAAYILAADNDAFKNRMNATQKALEAKGVKTAGVVNVLTKDTDFTAAATQAMGLKPDVILVYHPGAGRRRHRRPEAIAAMPSTIVGNDVLSPAPIFKKIGTSVVGVPFPVSFSPMPSSRRPRPRSSSPRTRRNSTPRPTSIRRRATR